MAAGDGSRRGTSRSTWPPVSDRPFDPAAPDRDTVAAGPPASIVLPTSVPGPNFVARFPELRLLTLTGSALVAIAVPVAVDRSAPDAVDRFVEGASAICARTHDRLAALPPLRDPQDIRAAAPIAIAATHDAARRLTVLPTPDARLPARRAYVAFLERQERLLGRMLRAARREDARAILSVHVLLNDNSARGQDAGRRLDAEACGGSTPPREPRGVRA